MSQQLALRLSHTEAASFDNFVIAEGSDNIIPMLSYFLQDAGDPFFLLWGEHGSGKSHLLNAACAEYERMGHTVAYLPISDISQMGAELLDGIEQYDLVCIDDIHLIAGSRTWETALFNLYNQLRNSGKKILVSSLSRPDKSNYLLPDLLSRLQWGMTFQLHSLLEVQKKQLISNIAKQRGLPISNAIIDYLFKHHDRDLKPMIALIDKLDKESLKQKRKITIPFVKEVINKP